MIRERLLIPPMFIVITFEFWNNYNNPFEPIIKNIYDKFLKANKVKAGIKSYNQSLSLILKYNKLYND